MTPSTIVSVLAFVVSVAAFLVATRQLKSARLANDRVVALDWLTRELTSDEFLESEAYVLDKLGLEQSPEQGVSGLPLAARRHVLRVGRYYASLGQLVVFGVVSEDLILSTVHFRLWNAWDRIAPFAMVERENRGAPFFAFFEHIAFRARVVDVSKMHRRYRLRKFPVT